MRFGQGWRGLHLHGRRGRHVQLHRGGHGWRRSRHSRNTGLADAEAAALGRRGARDALFSGVAAATSGSGFGASAAAAAAARPTRPTLATRTVGGHVSLGGATRGVQRGNKPAPMKLGARKLNPGDIDLESMLN